MKRIISLEHAKSQYPHRYTMEHVPNWALVAPDALKRGEKVRPGYYAPQFRTDAEWYANTLFPGEGHVGKREEHCYTSGQTWPLGQWLDAPFSRVKVPA